MAKNAIEDNVLKNPLMMIQQKVKHPLYVMILVYFNFEDVESLKVVINNDKTQSGCTC